MQYRRDIAKNNGSEFYKLLIIMIGETQGLQRTPHLINNKQN